MKTHPGSAEVPVELHGKWLVQYARERVTYPQALGFLLPLQWWLRVHAPGIDAVEVRIDPGIDVNTYSHVDYHPFFKIPALIIHLKDNNFSTFLAGGPGGASPWRSPRRGRRRAAGGSMLLHPIATWKKVESVVLLNPVRANDRRWDTIPLTTASLYLGSALSAAGYRVAAGKLPVASGVGEEWDFSSYDMVGFTLFEDLFLETRELLGRIREESPLWSGPLLAGGGPMVTLSPLQSAFHLPQLNLLVRGEAELLLPRLLAALNREEPAALFEEEGFLFQVPGLILVSGLDKVNRPVGPVDFQQFPVHLEFLERRHLESGLEINFSRGCRRGCVFCSHVQGREVRQLPEETVDRLLGTVARKLESFSIETPHCRTVNINDDDILQDLDYAVAVFDLLRKHRFRLWGIQTSLGSFFRPDHTIDPPAIETAAQADLYVEEKPLVWAGTDAFLPERGKKLGKWIPPEEALFRLAEAFEKKNIRHYHYWISSDHASTWDEFGREFRLIYRLYASCPGFGLLAHAPFVVPYATTPLYRLLMRRPETAARVKYTVPPGEMQAGTEFSFPLVKRVDTPYPHLNRLLDNEKAGAGKGFFDWLKEKDYLQAAITLYNFLKQERLAYESSAHPEAGQLKHAEQEMEEFISEII